MVAVPNQLLMVIGRNAGLDLELEAGLVVDQLNADGIGANVGDALNDVAAIIEIDPPQSAQAVLNELSRLQREGRSVDLNYLEPVQPNYGFRPADDPLEVPAPAAPSVDPVDEPRIVVIDSPDDSEIAYDAGSNLLVDEDHGHGVFVESIIERYVNPEVVELIGVQPNSPTTGISPDGATTVPPNPSLLASGRWAPMMFRDSEIVVALSSAGPEIGFVNMSLGGVGCPDDGGGERLTLARVMNDMLLDSPDVKFVAAAGNSGENVMHFPAAWRDADVASVLRSDITGQQGLVDDADGEAIDTTAVAAEIETMHNTLTPLIYAVGSVEQDEDVETKSGFSNCGDWVNAAAYGSAAGRRVSNTADRVCQLERHIVRHGQLHGCPRTDHRRCRLRVSRPRRHWCLHDRFLPGSTASCPDRLIVVGQAIDGLLTRHSPIRTA